MKISSKILLVMFILVISLSSVSAFGYLEVTKYDPIPAQAGEYVDIWVKFQNKGDQDITHAIVKFKATYPFTLDPTEKAERDLGLLKTGEFAVQKYKIRVDKGAVEGENPISFQYKDCISCTWNEITPIINVIEAVTDFEIVVQELSKEGTSIAISNIGKNTANSITIKIPKQDDFEVKGISSTIIGNLDKGDYTIAAYNIIPQKQENNLNVEISYTDPLGVRHKILKTVPYMSKSDYYEIYNKLNGLDQSSSFNIWFWIAIILVVIWIVKYIRKRRGKKK